jgi:hypothetical protein
MSQFRIFNRETHRKLEIPGMSSYRTFAAAFLRRGTCASSMGEIMPGDPRECRKHAARCLELAASSANEGIKQTFLNIAKHWQMLAEELERHKTILDDEKGTLKFNRKKRRSKKSGTKKISEKRSRQASYERSG